MEPDVAEQLHLELLPVKNMIENLRTDRLRGSVEVSSDKLHESYQASQSHVVQVVGNTRQEGVITTWTLCKRDQTSRSLFVWEREWETSSWYWRQRGETRFGVSQNQLCFVHMFLILDTLYNCYQKGDSPMVVVMKKCTNNSSFSLFWRLSVDINGISVLSI